MIDTLQPFLERAVFPAMVALVVWFVTKRRSDRATIAKMTADTTKAAADGRVSEGTVHAAIELADVGTLQAHVAAMSAAFKEERESLTRRLDEADQKVTDNRQALEHAYEIIEDLRADQARMHRELVDMWRRDQHHAQAFQNLQTWLTTNLPRMREHLNDLSEPPAMQPLPPLLVTDEQDAQVPHRRWYDDTGGPPAVTPPA